jgi:hypothetical protein
MPPRKARATKKKDTDENEELKMNQMAVQYNPEIVQGALKDYYLLVEAKCVQLQRDADFMVTSLQHEFQCEMFKLPKQVKEMSLSKFKEEFGGSVEQVTKSAFSMKSGVENMNFNVETRLSPKSFQTPAQNRRINPAGTVGTTARVPKEGEQILSANGSPLGEFSTVKKALRSNNNNGIIPPTPGVFVPLKNGEILDIENVEVENFTEEMKLETLSQMQAMMENMKSMMEKLKSGAV